MLTIPVYNPAGEKVGEETIDPADFGGAINKQLLHEVVLMHLAARRVGTVNTRGRADVAGSGKKLFRQKGTGNARVGAKRTNKRKGGGVSFARRNRDYRYALPKKAVRAAIRMALLSKFQDHQAIVLDGVAASQPKTREFAKIFQAIRRPDLTEGEAAETVGETKTKARGAPSSAARSSSACPRTTPRFIAASAISRGSRSRRWPNSTPTTFCRQRYLVLTREALATLKAQSWRKSPDKTATTSAASQHAVTES